MKNKKMGKMRHVLLLLAFLISGTIPQPVYAYQDTVCHVMTSDSIKLYVHVKGEGSMCLYLHGGPGSGSTWMEAVSGHILEKRFTMVYLDQRGVCKSETPKNDDFSFARQIQDWEEVRQALGIDHWLLMGHSWGGILMMGYWKTHPNVIDGMMFINCTLSRDTSFVDSWLPRALSILGDTASPVAKDESRPLKERMMVVFPQLNDDNRWMLFTPNKWANDSIGSWRFHKDCISHGKGETPLFMDEYGEDFRPLTSAIKVPVLYLYGRQDYAVGPEHYKTLHFPNAIIQGADCGHIVFLEEPAMFAEALDKFCQLLLAPISQPEVKLLIEIRPEVNYVTHLYTLAELGFSDSTYAAKYGNTLPKAAIDTLQKYKKYLTFGQGEGGMLAGPFFFGVSAENIPNVDSMQVMMNVVLNEGKKANAPVDVMAAVRAIANVYVAHYDAYLKNIYPQVKADMEERRQMLSQRIQKLSFVKDWERVTGYTWRRGDYHWLLYRAGQKGPSYNNLNDSTNTVWYNQDIDYQLAMFSHEFGIFLMQDSIDPIVEEFKEYTRKLDSDRDLTYVPWSAFESLACWYNCKIAGRKTADYHAFGEADVKTFCQIFDSLSKDGISDPAELYRKGVKEYLKQLLWQ
jgi:pimeloyl-ACP methyl ester carboxylesterase